MNAGLKAKVDQKIAAVAVYGLLFVAVFAGYGAALVPFVGGV